VTDALSELKAACNEKERPTDLEAIGLGRPGWVRGRPAPAAKGTVALALSRDVIVVIDEKDVREAVKDGEHFLVSTSERAKVLVRIEAPAEVAFTPARQTAHSRECACAQQGSPPSSIAKQGDIIDIEIGPITFCYEICVEIAVDEGDRTTVRRLCFPYCGPMPPA
jgi:hypothetical protein